MKTAHEMKEMLSEQMDKVKAKKSTPAEANSLCNLTGKFLSIIRLELDYAKLTGTRANIGQFINGKVPRLKAG